MSASDRLEMTEGIERIKRLKIIVRSSSTDLTLMPVRVTPYFLKEFVEIKRRSEGGANLNEAVSVKELDDIVQVLTSAIEAQADCRVLTMKCSNIEQSKDLLTKGKLHFVKNMAVENALASLISVSGCELLIHFVGDLIIVHDIPTDCHEKKVVETLLLLGFKTSDVKILPTYGTIECIDGMTFHLKDFACTFCLRSMITTRPNQSDPNKKYFEAVWVKESKALERQPSTENRNNPLSAPQKHPTLVADEPMPLGTSSSQQIVGHSSSIPPKGTMRLPYKDKETEERDLFCLAQLEKVKACLTLEPERKTMAIWKCFHAELPDENNKKWLSDYNCRKLVHIRGKEPSIHFAILDVEGHHISVTCCKKLLQAYRVPFDLDLDNFATERGSHIFKTRYYGMVNLDLEYRWFGSLASYLNKKSGGNYFRMTLDDDDRLDYEDHTKDAMDVDSPNVDDDDSDTDVKDSDFNALMTMCKSGVILIEADSLALFSAACQKIVDIFTECHDNNYFDVVLRGEKEKVESCKVH